MFERWDALAKFPYPKLDAVFLAGAMRGAMAMLIVAGAVWLVKGLTCADGCRPNHAESLAPARAVYFGLFASTADCAQR